MVIGVVIGVVIYVVIVKRNSKKVRFYADLWGFVRLVLNWIYSRLES